MDIIKLTNLYILCLLASDKISEDRAWMYTGHPNQKEMTTEWVMKTKEFLKASFANGQRKTWCPYVRCDNYKQTTEVDMGKHLQKWGFKPDYMVWTFHDESVGRTREEVVRQRKDEYRTGIEDMV